MLKTLHAIECSHALAARVAVCNKGTLKNRGGIVIQQVMHHAVAKMGGKHFSFHRTPGNKTDTLAHLISMVAQFFVQPHKVFLKIEFKIELAACIPFVFPGVIVGAEHINQ